MQQWLTTPMGYLLFLFVFRFTAEMCYGISRLLEPKHAWWSLLFSSLGKALGALGFGAPDQAKPFRFKTPIIKR